MNIIIRITLAIGVCCLLAIIFLFIINKYWHKGNLPNEVDCSINGIKVSCEDYPSTRGGINGVCPGLNESKTVEECIKEAQR